jgi:uncharacterized membrane protein YtjA (UPF0391 family)
MTGWIILFLLLSAVSGFFAFSGTVVELSGIAQILFFISVALLLLSLITLFITRR